jgi:hypothetical protein
MVPVEKKMTTSTPTWQDRQTIKLDGLRVTLSTPIAVGRSRGYLWFPNLWQMPNGDLLATISPVADIHMSSIPYLATWSRDGGLTWSEPVVTNDGGQTLLQLASGDAILLPYILRPRTGSIGAPYNRILGGTRAIEYVPTGVTVTGLPGPSKVVIPGLDMDSFSFNGQTVQLRDGAYLATVYGELVEPSGYRIFSVISSDGVHWQIYSQVADKTCGVVGKEAPNESALLRLNDGRILCVFRVASRASYGQCWSSDEGKTWSAPVAMDGPFSVQPSLATRPDGVIALGGGRPGIYLWFNTDGDGHSWQRIDMQAHHNACHPGEAIAAYAEHNHQEQTSAYTEVITVDDHNFLYIYDRLANGWRPIPETMDDTNSVWLVRVTVERS